MTIKAQAYPLRKYLNLLAGPLGFILLAFSNIIPADPLIQKTLGIAFWVIYWWVSEAVSMAATSLFPLILFPLFAGIDFNTIAPSYANQTVFLFMAGFIFALAMEKHQLHVRIALYIVKFIGTATTKLVLGFMIATAFISMWISNSAAALLMFPVANSVLILLKDEFIAIDEEEEYRKFAICLLLGLAYSASIGGISTIIGSPVNMVFTGLLKQYYKIDMTFSEWFMVGFPLAIVMLTICYFLLVKVIFRINARSLPGAEKMLNEKIQQLGKISYPERVVAIVFALTALGWIVRTPLSVYFKLDLLNDTTIGLTGALLLFIIPQKNSAKGYVFDWGAMAKFEWGILMMIGGGLALAKAFEVSGIIKLIGSHIAASGINDYLILLVIIIAITLSLKLFITTNTALSTIIIPMVFGISEALHYAPQALGFPVALAISFAFILPISTPPNAIVFSSGQVKVKDMALAGIAMTIIGFLLLIAIFSIYKK
jgi:sodium-dependent dicarboxylate transporter 2/3/5